MPVVYGKINEVIGPTLELLVGPGQERIEALAAVGRKAALPVRCKAVLDTGAELSAIDPQIIARLDLVPVGIQMMQTLGTGGKAIPCATFDITLAIDCSSDFVVSRSVRVDEVPIFVGPFRGAVEIILGRDVLDDTRLTYDGRRGRFRWRV